MAPIDPIGQDTYKGLSVPLYGESVIRQQNSSAAPLTLMHSSDTPTAAFIMGIDYKDLDANPTSVLTDLAMFNIDAAGGYNVLSGTTVIYSLNTSGFYKGTSKIVNTSGHITNYNVRQVVAMTTGANYSPVSSQSGTLFTWGINDATSAMILLPKNPPAGTWFEFYFSSQDEAKDVEINCTANSSAVIVLPGMTSAASTCDCITPATTVFHTQIRMTAISSVVWFAWPSVGYAPAVATTEMQINNLSAGHWTTGSTA